MEKSASTAPARVPVAINGDAAPGDQAKVAVRGISRRRTMMTGGEGWLCGKLNPSEQDQERIQWKQFSQIPPLYGIGNRGVRCSDKPPGLLDLLEGPGNPR